MAGRTMSLLAVVFTAILTRGASAEDAKAAEAAVEEANSAGAAVEDATAAKEESKQTYAESGIAAFDADKDGKISLHEFLEGVHANPEVADQPEMQEWSQKFKEADKDKDMHLNAEELEFFQRKKTLGEIALAGFDADKDGKISLHELLEAVHEKPEVANHPSMSGWSQGFKEADKDKDMHLDAEELESLFDHAKKQHRDELMASIEESAKGVMEGWDTDKDGKISLIEFTDHMHTNKKAMKSADFKHWHTGFKEADTDKDMHLDMEELKRLLATVTNQDHKDHPLHEEL